MLECILENLIKGKKITTEGYLSAFTPAQLAKLGEFAVAHAMAPILEDFLQTKLLYPEQVKAEKLGLPRLSIEDYRKDYIYTDSCFK